jgi:hypothetical protein
MAASFPRGQNCPRPSKVNRSNPSRAWPSTCRSPAKLKASTSAPTDASCAAQRSTAPGPLHHHGRRCERACRRTWAGRPREFAWDAPSIATGEHCTSRVGVMRCLFPQGEIMRGQKIRPAFAKGDGREGLGFCDANGPRCPRAGQRPCLRANVFPLLPVHPAGLGVHPCGVCHDPRGAILQLGEP